MDTGTVKFGAAYYPECFDKEQWKQDVGLMVEAGFNVVRLAEFAWSTMEPAEGRFEFDWLDEFIELAGKNGIRAILGTPTEAAPHWFMVAHPDAQIIGENGLRHGPLSRRQHCCHHPEFRRISFAIVEAMARRFGRNANVLGWQIDNEFGTHSSINCFCDRCLAAFRKHVAGKYGTVQKLNQAWYSAFWSHSLTTFDHILLPVNTHMGGSPQQWLEWRKFGGECWAKFGAQQCEILRRHIVDQRITHNCGWYQEQLDPDKTMAPMDFAGIDLYQREPQLNALINILWASIKPGKKHWVMEMSSGDREPRFHRQTFFMNYLRGAEGCSMWHFRGHRGGQEMGGGCVGLWGDGGPSFDGLKETGTMLKQIGPELIRNRPVYDVAVLHTFEDMLLGNRFHRDVGLPQWKTLDGMIPLIVALEQRGVAAAIRRPWSDLSQFPVVFAPQSFSIGQENAARLETYVRDGGIFVAAGRLGLYDEYGKYSDTRPPRHLHDLFGMTLGHVADAPEGKSFKGAFTGAWGRGTFACARAHEIIPSGAKILAKYTTGPFKGTPAATINAYGKGVAIYTGMHRPEEASLGAIIERILKQTSLKWHAPHPADLMCIRGDRLTGYLNLSEKRAIQVRLARPALELLSGKSRSSLKLPPFGIALVRAGDGRTQAHEPW